MVFHDGYLMLILNSAILPNSFSAVPAFAMDSFGVSRCPIMAPKWGYFDSSHIFDYFLV